MVVTFVVAQFFSRHTKMCNSSSKHVYQRRIRLLQSIRSFFGIAPVAGSAWKRYLHFFWCLVLVNFVFGNLILRAVQFNLSLNPIEKLLFLIKYPSSVMLTGLLILRAHKIAAKFKHFESKMEEWQAFLCLDAEAEEKFYAYLKQRTLIVMLGIPAFHAVCILIDFFNSDTDWFLAVQSNSAYNLPNLMISLSLMHYAIVQIHFWQLQVQLGKRFVQICSPSFIIVQGKQFSLDANYERGFALYAGLMNRCDKEDTVQLFEHLRTAYSALMDLHRQWINGFDYVLLLNVYNSFISISEQTYAIFKFLDQPNWEEWLLFSYRSIWLVMHASRIWFIVSVNECIVEQKCKLSLMLNELDIGVAATQLKRAINSFLLQLNIDESQPICVCGILDLDTLALSGLISALMAIVIFLIQIDLGNNTLISITMI